MGVIDYLIRRRVKAIEDRSQVFEVTGLTIPAGTDWHLDGHVLGTLELPAGACVLMSFYIEVSAPLANGDAMCIGEWPTPGHAAGSEDYGATLTTADAPKVIGRSLYCAALPNVGIDPNLNEVPVTDVAAYASVNSVQQVGLFNGGATINNITVVRARAAFQVI